MVKNFSKLLFLLFTVSIIFCTSFCNATEAVKTSETDKATNSVETTGSSDTETTTINDTPHYGDLYIFDLKNDVVLVDKVIYGNVYIIAANNVEITGQIEGNLFVVAKNLKLDKSYIGGSIFACTNNIYYNAASTYLYSISNNIEMTFDSYVVRDAKIKSNNATLKAAIGRDLDLISNTINLGENENIPIVYGSLRYTSNNEINIPEGVLTENGAAEYTSAKGFINILIKYLTIIIITLGLFIILSRYSNSIAFNNKLNNSNISIINLLKSFVLGIASLLLFLLVFFVLMISMVGAKLKLSILLAILLTCLALIVLPAIPLLAICITNKLKKVLKIQKTYMLYIILSVISILLYSICLIPFAGILINIIFKVSYIGLIVNIYLPSKNNNLNNKEKKQRKFEDRVSKKLSKFKSKESKNNNSTDL